MQGFDRARPLWEFTVVDGLQDGGAAVIAKIHHAITDGVGGVKLLMELLDLERTPTTEPEMPSAPDSIESERAQAHRRRVGLRDSPQRAGTRPVSWVRTAREVRQLVTDPVGVGMDAMRTAAVAGAAAEPVDRAD